MDRTSLISLLDQYGLNPSTDTLDQHFIVNEAAVKTVVDTAELSAGEHVLEIGPGPGQLTRELLSRGAVVTAIELDTRFQEILADLQKEFPDRLKIIWGSALTEPWPSEVSKLVMNPPYSILEALLEKIHEAKEITSVSMIIGKRYYQNAVTKVGDNDFTKTALMTQARFDPFLVEELSKDSFYPEAGAKSVIMSLKLRHKPHPVLYRLADFFVLDAQASVNFVLQQALEPFNKKAKKYKDYTQFVTVGSLGFKSDLLNKRLQDLSNQDIRRIVGKFGHLYNTKVAKKKTKLLVEEDEE